MQQFQVKGTYLERSKYQVRDKFLRLLIRGFIVQYPYKSSKIPQFSLQFKSVLL
jgi:hypothetical protein